MTKKARNHELTDDAAGQWSGQHDHRPGLIGKIGGPG
jgi:hypothetical protein